MTLSERESAVLYAVVSEFIGSGEPVGSRTLSTKYGLEISAATIRNVLADLEDKGYLVQPHTSAGRVPTPLAFRLFIDALMRLRNLRREDAERIRELFAVPMASEVRLREAGKLLSELSGSPAVVVRTRGESRRLQRVRFIATKPGEMLAVLVFEDSTVENRFIQVEGIVEAATLERLHNLLDEVIVGRSLGELSAHLSNVALREQDEIGRLVSLGESLLGTTITRAGDQREIIVEGTSTLLEKAESPARLRELMEALEDRRQLLQLLERTAGSSRVEVYLGGEGGSPVPFNLVAAGYGTSENLPSGALGVLGSARMDYPGLAGRWRGPWARNSLGKPEGMGVPKPPASPRIDQGSGRG